MLDALRTLGFEEKIANMATQFIHSFCVCVKRCNPIYSGRQWLKWLVVEILIIVGVHCSCVHGQDTSPSLPSVFVDTGV